MIRKLNLGCGLDLRKGWINHDRTKHHKHVHKVHDLNMLPWPWGASTVDQIDAISVFEHLKIDLITTLNECWRILRPEGVLRIKYPLFTSPFIHNDPTHRWFWSDKVVDFVDPSTEYGKKAIYYTKFKWEIRSRKISERNCWIAMRPIGK